MLRCCPCFSWCSVLYKVEDKRQHREEDPSQRQAPHKLAPSPTRRRNPRRGPEMLPPYLSDVPSSGEGNQALGTTGSGLGCVLYLKAGLSFTITSHQKLGCSFLFTCPCSLETVPRCDVNLVVSHPSRSVNKHFHAN